MRQRIAAAVRHCLPGLVAKGSSGNSECGTTRPSLLCRNCMITMAARQSADLPGWPTSNRGHQMKLYQRQFSDTLDTSFSSQPKCTVLIASTPRCGSHMLGHAMASTGLLGVPFEYANPANLAEWADRLGTVSPDDTLRAVMARRTTANGVFAIKAHFSHCESLGGPSRFLKFWPNLKVVHLRRADVLRQAISYAVARQTGVWIAGQEAESDVADYDPQVIAECLDDIAVQNASWVSAFASAGLTPISIQYESTVDDMAAVVTRCARLVGVIGADDVANVTIATARQARSDRTEDWIRRYAADRRPTGARSYGFSQFKKFFVS
jgi:trehalose 2-sulfotransferase